MYVCATYACLVPWRPEEDIRFPETGFTEGYELPYRFWELNQGSLQKSALNQLLHTSYMCVYL